MLANQFCMYYWDSGNTFTAAFQCPNKLHNSKLVYKNSAKRNKPPAGELPLVKEQVLYVDSIFRLHYFEMILCQCLKILWDVVKILKILEILWNVGWRSYWEHLDGLKYWESVWMQCAVISISNLVWHFNVGTFIDDWWLSCVRHSVNDAVCRCSLCTAHTVQIRARHPSQ